MRCGRGAACTTDTYLDKHSARMLTNIHIPHMHAQMHTHTTRAHPQHIPHVRARTHTHIPHIHTHTYHTHIHTHTHKCAHAYLGTQDLEGTSVHHHWAGQINIQYMACSGGKLYRHTELGEKREAEKSITHMMSCVHQTQQWLLETMVGSCNYTALKTVELVFYTFPSHTTTTLLQMPNKFRQHHRA